VVGEQELSFAPVAGMWQRPAVRADAGDVVDQLDGLVVEGDHPLGLQLPERDLQPGPVARQLVDAVQLKVEQLADAQPAGALQPQGAGGELVAGMVTQLRGQPPVGVRRAGNAAGLAAAGGCRRGTSACAAARRASPIR